MSTDRRNFLFGMGALSAGTLANNDSKIIFDKVPQPKRIHLFI